jgi:ABC-type transporter Mla subunit MlaD
MARKARNEVAVGITVLAVLALAIYIVVMLADWSSLFSSKQKITVRLPYRMGLKGLAEGSPVHLGGVKIGNITHTDIKKAQPGAEDANDIYVFFTMKISQQYQLRSDCELLPQSNVLGGETVLSIEDLGGDGEIIQDGQTVDLRLADDVMETIKREFNPNNPDSFIAHIKKDIPAITERLQQTITKANTALDTAQAALENLKEFSDDERIDRIVGNIKEVSTNLKLTSQEVRRAPWKLLYRPQEREYRIQALVDSAGAFAAGAEQLDDTAMRLQRLVEATDDKAPMDKNKIQSMVSELELTFEQFQKAENKFWQELE